MAWKDTLLDASFRGVSFEVITTEDTVQRAVDVYEFPFIDGGEPVDMGAQTPLLSVDAIFFGADYEARLAKFRAALAEPGLGELVHPVFGTHRVQVSSHRIRHTAEAPDSATVQVSFIVATVTARIFAAATPRQAAAAIGNQASSLRDLSGLAFLRGLNARIKGLTRQSDIGAVRQVLAAVASELRSLSPRAILSGVDFLDSPLALVADVRSALDALLDVPSLESIGLADWRRREAAVSSVSLSVIPTPTSPVAQAVLVLADDATRREAAVRRAEEAADVLSLEADAPTLNPVEIEEMANSARGGLQAAIVRARALYPLEDHHALSDGLKTTAWQVLDAARQVLAMRPPLIEREVPTECNLRLLAHWWYGDHARAGELLRLNPQIRNPNFLAAGQVLYAFAR